MGVPRSFRRRNPKGAFAIPYTLASLLLSYEALLHDVCKQLGPAKPTTTLDYAKWFFSGEERFVDVLDTQLEKVGTMSWHQVDIKEKEDEKFDGPCRG